MNVPEHLKYSLNHEWVNDSVQPAEVGITAFAAEALGDVIYVQLPEPGSHLTAGDVCGEVESTKSVAELYLPVSGEVVAVNEAVIANPDLFGVPEVSAARHTGADGLIIWAYIRPSEVDGLA
ncbi:glycine cleavage system protein H [Micromonospora aurantiaca]|uniref:glycine cleavage system protein H n=1 Tax=Micromonospora aurantiaca (nom. illeg.) TaxID=47850 RepID=UPI000F3E3034|nr:glycine cleavage system protein H [Micromonospora aurantiaca]RNH97435.1 glycine cleavage system protein H [Micromonospora aurantiaca]